MGEWLDRRFGISERKSSVRTEVIAGITTFMTMAYIIFVNPAILSEAGMDFGAVMTATCLASAAGTLIMCLRKTTPRSRTWDGLKCFLCFHRSNRYEDKLADSFGGRVLDGILFILLRLRASARLLLPPCLIT